jgi:hypothetical protein
MAVHGAGFGCSALRTLAERARLFAATCVRLVSEGSTACGNQTLRTLVYTKTYGIKQFVCSYTPRHMHHLLIYHTFLKGHFDTPLGGPCKRVTLKEDL